MSTCDIKLQVVGRISVQFLLCRLHRYYTEQGKKPTKKGRDGYKLALRARDKQISKTSNLLSILSSVFTEQQLQSLLCYLLPAAGESERASQPAAEPPVWNLEPKTQEHLRLHRPRGEHSS